LIRGQKAIVEAAHTAGLKIYGITYPPPPRLLTQEGEASRVAVNTWIRESGAFDAIADFDRALRDPAKPSRLLDQFLWGNPAVLSDIAFRAMAESFDVSVF